jgi:predicted TIM-barrel fold metal-dependent hydrolase
MATAVTKRTQAATDTARLLVFSADTHIGPRAEDLRPYCPTQHLEAFDEFYVGVEAMKAMAEQMGKMGFSDAALNGVDKNLHTAGHYDPNARLQDYERDGIAAAVIFHASQNGEPIPFDVMNMMANGTPEPIGREMAAVGRKIYNRWLADFCSVSPERHVGLAQLPMWDLDASIAELEWCAENGLRGVNFPCHGSSDHVRPYGPEFDPFFAAAASLDMTLATHVGARPFGFFFDMPADYHFGLLESGEWGIRHVYVMVIFGVFERHPNLKLVLTEVPGVRWEEMCQRMDSIFLSPLRRSEHLSKPPSEYMATNVWMGSSFMARHEAEAAIDTGCEDRFIWGSDYPHAEGTYSFSADPDEYPMSRLSLANTFHDMPIDKVRKIVGLNAFDAYPRLDRGALTEVVERVGVTAAEISTAPDLTEFPQVQNTGTMGFRTQGDWGP